MGSLSDIVRPPLCSTRIRSRFWPAGQRILGGLWRSESLRGRFARGAAWSLVGAVVSQGSGLAASVITARVLGREQFGEYGMIRNTVGMFGVFAGMGLGMTATRYVGELRRSDPPRARRIIALSTVVAVIASAVAAMALFAMAPWLAARFLNAPAIAPDLRIGAGVLFLNSLVGMQTGVLAGFEAFGVIARVSLARGVVTLPIALVGVWLGKLSGALAALAASAGVLWLLNHRAIRAECEKNNLPPRTGELWADRDILWKFSLPSFLGSAMGVPSIWLVNSMLVARPQGYLEMGLFSAANQWGIAVTFVPAILSQPLLSLLSHVGAEDPNRFARLLRANLLLNLSLSAGMATVLIVCSRSVMRAYGPAFVDGRQVLTILALAGVVSSTASVMGQAIASLNRMWQGFWLNLAWSAALIAGARPLTPRYGALGMAMALLLAYSVQGLGVFACVQRNLRRPSGETGLGGPALRSALQFVRAGGQR